MADAWRAYLEVALGATEASRKKATKVVKRVLGRGGATAEQVQQMANDLLTASAANREAVAKLVKQEVDKALGKVGLVSADEVAALRAQVRELEKQLNTARAGAAEPAGTRAPQGDTTAAADKPVAKKAVAKKAVAKKAAAAPINGAAAPTVVPALAPEEAAAAAELTEAQTPAKKTAPAKKVARKAATSAGETEPAGSTEVQPAPTKKAASAKKAAPARKAAAPKKAAGSPDAADAGSAGA
ncbi:phasin family protein [Luedemannella helvata]|uniref:Polyhydroxyalkanoate synthesis regulator phasin n=1 Tax=Luedemannella helvata TaxID=349315 RepID=A0ABN2L4L2_9ACTN